MLQQLVFLNCVMPSKSGTSVINFVRDCCLTLLRRRHLHESQNLVTAAGGKTPFGAGGRTPARPGGATPGHMSVRQVGRTPNPYGNATAAPYGAPIPGNATPAPYGAPIPGYGMPPSTPYGYQTPHRPPNYPAPSRPLAPPGMADRTAAVPQHSTSSGWGSSGWM